PAAPAARPEAQPGQRASAHAAWPGTGRPAARSDTGRPGPGARPARPHPAAPSGPGRRRRWRQARRAAGAATPATGRLRGRPAPAPRPGGHRRIAAKVRAGPSDALSNPDPVAVMRDRLALVGIGDVQFLADLLHGRVGVFVVR